MRPTSSPAPVMDLGLDAPPPGAPVGVGTIATTLDLAIQLAGAEIALLHLAVGDGSTRTWRSGPGQDPLVVSGPCGHVSAQPGRVLAVRDARLDARFAGDRLVHGSAALPRHVSVPVLDGDARPMGAICVLGREPRDPRRSETVALRSLATRLTEEIRLRDRVDRLEADKERQRLLEADLRRSVSALTRQTSTDELTGLLNRRAIRGHLDDEVERHLRYGADLSVAMIDIDHFKSVNDEHGHRVGDDALVAVASVLLRYSRATDLCSRYGGEEFVVLMPETDREGAVRSAERLRAGVAELDLGFPLTVSIGLATAWGEGTTVAELLERADGSLYAAKALGRDRVIWATQAHIEPARSRVNRAG